jgi:hypothetical protein
LILQQQRLNDDLIKPIFKLFLDGVKVKKLNLADNLISDGGIKNLSEIMANNCPIELEISDNNLSYKSLSFLAKLILKN